MNSIFPRIGAVLLAALALLPIACGGGNAKTAVVRGKVTLNGQPVANGTVLFVPDSGPSATGEIQPDGTYTLTTFSPDDGAVLGSHKVMITAVQDTTNALPEAGALPPPIIPAKYLSTATSGLTATVEDKENVIDFPLEGDKTPRKKR